MSEMLSRDEFLQAVAFNADGLVPVIAQDHKSSVVLMLAWMNRDTLLTTLETGDVTYWSRSRKAVWRKGETSGHVQKLIEADLDCDGDAILLKVDQTGPACHTGNDACFYRKLRP
jgi:phosphoribosyl-AMP cyclohydrolase